MFLFKNFSNYTPSTRNKYTKQSQLNEQLKTQKPIIISDTIKDFKNDRDLCEALASNDIKCNWRCSTSEEEDCVLEEMKRLKTLRSLVILDTTPERRFEQLTGMASKEFDVPIALVSLVDLGRLWFKSNRGLGDAREVVRPGTLCGHVVSTKEDMLIVPDTTKDHRFMDKDFVTGPPHIRFYAGCPLISSDGYRIGSFCVISSTIRPEGLNKKQKLRLKEYADLAVQTLEQRQLTAALDACSPPPASLTYSEPYSLKNSLDSNDFISPPKKHQFGDLFITFTNNFDCRFQMSETEANKKCAIYHPKPPIGFHALGSICLPEEDNLTKEKMALCVSAASESSLVAPSSYQLIWNSDDVSCWRPVAPTGYTTFGDVFVQGKNQKPSREDIVCVRKDIVNEALVGAKLWSYDSAETSQSQISVFEVVPTLGQAEEQRAIIGVQTFRASTSTIALNDHDFNSLHLPFPIAIKKNGIKLELKEQLSQPQQYSESVLSYRIPIPCSAIKDSSMSFSQKVIHSPFYYVLVDFKYHLELYKHNLSDTVESIQNIVMVGFDEESSNFFTALTGICLKFGNIINLASNLGEFSYSFKIDQDFLGFNVEESLGVQPKVCSLQVEPKKSAAIWSLVCNISLRNMKDVVVGKDLEFTFDQFKDDYLSQDHYC